MLFGISPPLSLLDFFNKWSKRGNKNLNSLLLTAATLSWTVWLTRNKVIFDKSRPKSCLQILFRGNSLASTVGKIAASSVKLYGMSWFQRGSILRRQFEVLQLQWIAVN